MVGVSHTLNDTLGRAIYALSNVHHCQMAIDYVHQRPNIKTSKAIFLIRTSLANLVVFTVSFNKLHVDLHA